MAQATWTEATGSKWRTRTAHVRIALPALAVQAWNCHTWSVDIVLPAAANMKADGEGVTVPPTGYAGLAAGATAEFAIQVAAAAHNCEIRKERGWLRVKVRNPTHRRACTWRGRTDRPCGSAQVRRSCAETERKDTRRGFAAKRQVPSPEIVALLQRAGASR